MARHPHGSMDITTSQGDRTRVAHLVPHTSGLPLPEPNPPYVFPGFKDPATMQESYSAQAKNSESTTSSRRPVSRSRPQHLSINALPLFEFGAGSGSSVSTRGPSPSPTRSPSRRTPPLHPASGHRRGGSEFVGGDVANPITAGVSPVKSDEALPPKQSGPPPTRRGHAHRRSGALSQHDLSMILRPPNDSKGGSAPTTPSDLSFDVPRPTHPEMDRSLSQPAPTTNTEDVLPSSLGPDHNQSRTRVTFNSDPEYIPRPLSTISSDTSSSMSTVRANHSVTDSISSLVSGGPSSPPSTRIARVGSDSIDGGSNCHRKKSSASVSRVGLQDQVPRESQRTDSCNRPVSAPSGGGDDQDQGSEGLDDGSTTEYHAHDTGRLKISRQVVSGSHPPTPASLFEGGKQQTPIPGSPTGRPRTSPEPKVAQRHQKVKSWAGSILSRKAKQQMIQTVPDRRRTPVPPQPRPTTVNNAEFSLDDITFDEDTTCIIETPRSAEMPSSLGSNTFYSSNNHSTYKPRPTNLFDEEENLMLDIDAALGSLDRPGSSSAAFDGGGGFMTTKRRMHSSGETGGFSGPGMHYHRRTESAPELEFFDHGRLGSVHRGSNPAMAEAIEEEEEEGEDIVENLEHKEDQETGLGVNIVESEQAHSEPLRRRTRRADDSRNEAVSPLSLDSESQRALGGVEIVGADEEPRFSVVTKSSDGSTITPTLSPEPLAPTSAPLEFAVQPSSLYQASETASAISSPDFAKSSFDNHDPPRLHTATSSITDRATLSSSRTGEHGHGSIDDVPSLTSSASTMISGHPTRFSSSANTTASSADRSSSLSAAVPARTSVRPGSSKRSSLASLSRLVGSSHNKSKLHIAELAPPDSPRRSEKKRGKRMSRLMFWKSRQDPS